MTNSTGHHGLSDEDSDSEIMDYSQQLKRKSNIRFDLDLSVHYEIPQRPKKIPRVPELITPNIYSACLASLSNPANRAVISLISQVDELSNDFLKIKLLSNEAAFTIGSQIKSNHSSSIKKLSNILGQYNKRFLLKEKQLSSEIQQQLDKLAETYKQKMLAETRINYNNDNNNNNNNEIVNKPPISRKHKEFDKYPLEGTENSNKEYSAIPSRFKESRTGIASSKISSINSPLTPEIFTPVQALVPPAALAPVSEPVQIASTSLTKKIEIKPTETHKNITQSPESIITVGIPPDYITLTNKKIESLASLQNRIDQAIITEEWRTTIDTRLNDILQRLVFLSENSLDIQKENSLTESLQIENFILGITVDAKDIIRETSSSTSNKDIVIAIAWKLVTQLIDSAMKTKTEEGLWLLGFIAYNICDMIPTLWPIFFLLLVKNCPLILPDYYFQFHNNHNSKNILDNNNNLEEKFRLLIFYGNILVNSSNVTTTTILYSNDSYLWLSRTIKQLYNISIKLLSPTTTTTTNISQLQLYTIFLIICKSLRLFLRSAGIILLSFFHTSFIQILEKLKNYLTNLKSNPIMLTLANNNNQMQQQSSLNSSFLDLLEMVQKISNNLIQIKTVRASQECHILKAKTLKRFLDIFRNKAESVDSDKSMEMQQRKDAIKIEVPGTELSRLNGTFNIIGESPESQQKALARLQQTIVQTSQTGDKDLLQHALHKLSLVAVTHCQTQHFNVEKHALSVVRVLNELCNGSPILQDLLRAQFYTMCPLCIPIFTIENADNNEFRTALGFKSAISKEDNVTIIWESEERWIERMIKLLGTYAMLSIQLNGSVFTMKDIWAWLSRTVNYCGSISPPWMTAKILYTVLTIVSSDMKSNKEFETSFLNLLRIIRYDIVPRLNKSDQYIGDQERLQKYLDDELK